VWASQLRESFAKAISPRRKGPVWHPHGPSALARPARRVAGFEDETAVGSDSDGDADGDRDADADHDADADVDADDADVSFAVHSRVGTPHPEHSDGDQSDARSDDSGGGDAAVGAASATGTAGTSVAAVATTLPSTFVPVACGHSLVPTESGDLLVLGGMNTQYFLNLRNPPVGDGAVYFCPRWCCALPGLCSLVSRHCLSSLLSSFVVG
jgi:hypothetical protein